MDSEEDAKVAQTLIIKESLAELFNFVEELEQQVKHKQYCCQQVWEGNENAIATASRASAIAEVQCFDINTEDELLFESSYI